MLFRSPLTSPLSSTTLSTFSLLPTIKLVLVHSPSPHSSPFFVVVFGIFLGSSLHISDWSTGRLKHEAFLKALVCAWACLAPRGHVLLFSSAPLISYITSSKLDSLFLSHALWRSFSSFLSHHYSHWVSVFKVDKSHSLLGPPLWFSRSEREALARYDDSAERPSSRDLMLQE